MDNFKIGLDRYLTSSPDDSFNDWCEAVVDQISDSFFNTHEGWIDEYDGVCTQWLNALHVKDKAPQEAAAIIERAHRLYLNK